MQEMLRPSDFTEAMGTAFQDEIDLNKPIVNAKSSEDNQGLLLFLDRQLYLRPDFNHAPKINWGSFSIGVNYLLDSFNMRTGNLLIKYHKETNSSFLYVE